MEQMGARVLKVVNTHQTRNGHMSKWVATYRRTAIFRAFVEPVIVERDVRCDERTKCSTCWNHGGPWRVGE
jgi:hypothetical protein